MSARLALVLAVAALAAGIGAGGADAGRECDGLVVCIAASGPWVQVPGGAKETVYRFACPGRGQVIGGLDADRAGPLGISFLAQLGGPVSPGVTTGQAADFVAQTTRSLSGFRPLLGCIPGGGGGGRGRTLRSPQAAAPGPVIPEATVRRVSNVRLQDVQRQRLTHGCLAGERLLSFSSAIAFRVQRPPALSALGSVRSSERRSGNRVVVTVRSSIARPVGTAVDVQIHAVCVRGPS